MACVWQTTITEFSQIGAVALGTCLVAFTLLSSPPTQAAPPAIGRLEVNTNHCSFSASSNQKLSCFRIELTRKTDNVLRLRFIGEGDHQGQGRSLTFVAINPDLPLPLSCDQGQCALTAARWQGAVVGVAEAFTTSLGIAEGLPKAWPARGNCKLEQRQFTCTAEVSSGEVISAEGRL